MTRYNVNVDVKAPLSPGPVVEAIPPPPAYSTDSQQPQQPPSPLIPPPTPSTSQPPQNAYLSPSNYSFPPLPALPFMPTNHLKIHRPHQAIEGKWLIDTSLVLPKGILDPTIDVQTLANLELSSDHASVDVEVYVQGSQSTPKRALLCVSSDHNSVVLKIPRRTQRIDLLAISKYGQCKIYLPNDFYGPLAWNTTTNTIKFSPALQAAVTLFGQKNDGSERAFVGQWEGSGFGEVGKVWEGDEVRVEAQSGVYFYFAAERKR